MNPLYSLSISGEKNEETIFVLIEKTFKKMDHFYVIKFVKQFVKETLNPEIEKEVISIYNDKNYRCIKRVFSQERRPAKNVVTPPAIFMRFHYSDTSVIDHFRQNQIAIEGISIDTQEEKWRQQDYKTICLGKNYFVPQKDLIRCLADVIDSKRILSEVQSLNTSDFFKKSDEFLESFPLLSVPSWIESLIAHQLSLSQINLMFALAMPIWFYETVKIIKRYSGYK